MAQWVDMEALEKKSRVSLMIFLTPACAQCVIFRLRCLPIEPLGGLVYSPFGFGHNTVERDVFLGGETELIIYNVN